MDIKGLGVLVRDLNKPRALTYWADLAICLILTSMGLFLSWPFPESILSGSPSAFCGLVLSAFALFRASYFNHELAHHAGELPGFEIAWNVSVGIPLLIPSYLYSDHLNHHSVKGFATETDVEYFPPHLRGIRGAGLIVLASLLLPLIHTSRFLLVVPVAWFSPAIRRWADTRASSLGILGLSRRKPPTAKEAFSWRTQELGCFAYLVMMSCAVAGGAIPVGFVLQINTLIVIMLLLHGIRVMVGHRYEVQGSNDRIEQVLDSFNFTRNRWATILMAPLGFHLHALHHLFPKIPYHNLQEAHRRISGALPPDSFYHSVETPSYFRAVARFVLRGLSPTPSPDGSICPRAAEGPVDGREEKPVNHGAGAAGPSLA
jgi:fatty acid desaturase